MQRLLLIFAIGFLGVASLSARVATASETRVALVIGNASYKVNALATPINDAALVAQALEAAGFQVTLQRDLNAESLRKAFSDFANGVGKAGPDTVAAVYFAGYGLQLQGENYLLPIDTDMTATDDVAARAIRLSEQMHSLAALRLKASFLILDAARANPSSSSNPAPAGGFAWVEPEPNMLVAFSAAPGMVAREGRDPSGAYATALTEMLRDDGQTPVEFFDRVRLRVSELTKGAQVPWDASKIPTQFLFPDRNPAAPSRADWRDSMRKMRAQSLQKLGVRDAYFITLTRDTLDGYADFLADYWQDPLANRVQALLAARREALTWWRTYQRNIPEAYWTYLERYPHGPHTGEARSLLGRLGAPTAIPSKFARLEYDVPPPLPDELPFLERPVLMLDDPGYALASPPPLPGWFLGPQPEPAGMPKPAASLIALPAPVAASLPMIPGVSAGGAVPSDPLAPGRVDGGLMVRGTIGTPIRPSDKFTTTSIPQSDVSSPQNELVKPQPAAVAPLRETSTAAPRSSETDRKPVGQGFRRGLGVKPTAPTTGGPPIQDDTQSALGVVPPAISRPANVKRPANIPAGTSPRLRPQTTAGELQSSVPGTVPSPASKPAVRKPARPKAAGSSADKPDLGTRPPAACTDLDGIQPCN